MVGKHLLKKYRIIVNVRSRKQKYKVSTFIKPNVKEKAIYFIHTMKGLEFAIINIF